jgi:hypothetical protein
MNLLILVTIYIYIYIYIIFIYTFEAIKDIVINKFHNVTLGLLWVALGVCGTYPIRS